MSTAVKETAAKWQLGLYVTAVLLFWGLALNSMTGDTPIIDEPFHLSRGTAFLLTGDPRLSLEHPPLVNSWSALPMLTMTDEITLPLDDPSWTDREPFLTYWMTFARVFLWESGNDAQRMVFLGRIQIVLLTILFSALMWHVAQRVWSRPWAGFFGGVLVLLDPNIIAHGRYITTDLGGMVFMFLATYLLWRFWQRPSAGGWVALAAGIGLAFAAKLSAMTFVFIWIAMTIVPHQAEPAVKSPTRRLLYLAGAGLSSLVVVWAVFNFEWRSYIFWPDGRLVALNQYGGPLPTFLAGIERIQLLTGGGRGVSYLLGEYRVREGFLWYFPFVFLVKTPVLVQAAFYAAVGYLFYRPQTRRTAVWFSLPILIYMGFSMSSNLNLGYRHLFPLLPFVYLLIAGLLARLPRWTGTAVVGGSVAAVLLIHPSYLNYFNIPAGGPDNGHRLLAYSNVDWGEDLLRLHSWLDANQIDAYKLGWYGTVDLAAYGFDDYAPLPGPYDTDLWLDPPFDPADPEPGIYILSLSNLQELRGVPDEERTVYAWFREREPDAVIGYSVFVYVVE